MFQNLKLNDKFAFVAKTKSGKSWLGKKFSSLYPRRIIIDTTYEYTPEDGEIVVGFEAFSQKLLQIQDLDQYSVIFRFSHYDQNRSEIFEEICKLVFFMEDTFFVVEEIHLHSSPHSLNHWLLQIATIGSHRNIGYLITTQRPSLLNKTLLTQCDHIFIGSLIDMNDVRYISEFCQDKSKNLVNYPARKFIYWHLGQVTEVDTNNL